MKSPFPQSNLPRNTGGGRDVWNIRNAGAILNDLFFGLPRISSLTDDFNDNSIDTAKWYTYLDRATVTESGGQIRIAVNPNEVGAEGDLISVQKYNLELSAVSVAYIQGATPGVDSLFIVQSVPGNRLMWLLTTTTARAYVQDGYGTISSGPLEVLTPGANLFFRIREKNGTVYFDYSTDSGATWTNSHKELVENIPWVIRSVNALVACYEYSAVGATVQNTSIFDNFSVFSSATPVLITKSLAYRILTRTALTKSMRYVVRLITAPTKALTYRILLRTAITKSLRYVIRSVGVPITKAVTYRIRKAYSITKSLRYVIAVEAGITKSVRYAVLTKLAITKGITYRIRSVTSAITKAVTYRIKLVTAITKSLRYVIRGALAITKSLAYRIKTVGVITKSLQYVVTVGTTTSAITKALAYRIKTTLAITKSLRYVVRFLGAVTKSTTYRIRTRIAITKAIQYRIRLVGPLSKSVRYGIKRAYVINKALQYVVIVLTVGAITKALRYAILTRSVITKGLTYDVFAVMRASITKSMRYEIQRIFPFTESASPFTKMASPLTERANVFTPAVKPFTESPSPFQRFNE